MTGQVAALRLFVSAVFVLFAAFAIWRCLLDRRRLDYRTLTIAEVELIWAGLLYEWLRLLGQLVLFGLAIRAAIRGPYLAEGDLFALLLGVLLAAGSLIGMLARRRWLKSLLF